MNLHEPQSSRDASDGNNPRSTAAFPSVLIALIALGVIAWVGAKMMQPPPAPPVTAESASSANPAGEAMEETPDAAAAGENRGALATNEADPVCGMNPQRSAMRVETEFADGTLVAFDSLACYYEYVETIADSAAVTERIVAFDTYRLEHPVLLDFTEAVWLIDLDGSVPGAMPPGVAAFRSAEDAEKAKGNLGGKLASAAEMETYIYDYLQESGILD